MSDPLHSHVVTDVKASALLNGDSELRDSTTLGSTSLVLRGGMVFSSPGATQRVACWKALARGEVVGGVKPGLRNMLLFNATHCFHIGWLAESWAGGDS